MIHILVKKLKQVLKQGVLHSYINLLILDAVSVDEFEKDLQSELGLNSEQAEKLLLDVDNSKYKYRIGMTGDAEFILREIEDIIAVPSEFINREGSRKYVNIGDKKKRIKTYVTTGEVVNDFTQVKSGLKEGDVIYD